MKMIMRNMDKNKISKNKMVSKESMKDLMSVDIQMINQSNQEKTKDLRKLI